MFYGRVQSYGEALQAEDGAALAQALRRNIHPDMSEAPSMEGLAAWALRTEKRLAALSDDDIARGALQLPVPGQEDLQ